MSHFHIMFILWDTRKITKAEIIHTLRSICIVDARYSPTMQYIMEMAMKEYNKLWVLVKQLQKHVP